MAHPPRIPVWLPQEKEVVYFVTLCVQGRRPVLANARALEALRAAVDRLEHWWVYAAVVMPDHIHVLAAPDDREAPVGNLAGALKRWVRQGMTGTATTAGGAPTIVVGQAPRLPSEKPAAGEAPALQKPETWHWQSGSFDRLLRTEESAQAKWEYMRENPVRAGLVARWEDWPYSIGFREPQDKRNDGNRSGCPTMPDLLRGVHTPADWRRRRTELLGHLLRIEYGSLPVTVPVAAELLNEHSVARFGGARHVQYHLRAADKQWVLDLLIPDGSQRVVLNGDGCWRYLTDEVTGEVLRRGFTLAAFNRCEVMPDTPASQCAIAWWAWAYHRCVDFLLGFVQQPGTRTGSRPAQPGRRARHGDRAPWLPEFEGIAVVGHSRGGKAALLAGATDERIALVGDNSSGCCGSAPLRLPATGAETLAIITERFPHWFAPGWKGFAGREGELPFDQHALLACIAPRPLICTMASGDLWANPVGTKQCIEAARPAWKLHGAEAKLAWHERAGQHEHNAVDWRAFLEFADKWL